MDIQFQSIHVVVIQSRKRKREKEGGRERRKDKVEEEEEEEEHKDRYVGWIRRLSGIKEEHSLATGSIVSSGGLLRLLAKSKEHSFFLTDTEQYSCIMIGCAKDLNNIIAKFVKIVNINVELLKYWLNFLLHALT